MEEKVLEGAVEVVKLAFRYDGLSRRIGKRVCRAAVTGPGGPGGPGAWGLTEQLAFE